MVDQNAAREQVAYSFGANSLMETFYERENEQGLVYKGFEPSPSLPMSAIADYEIQYIPLLVEAGYIEVVNDTIYITEAGKTYR